MSSTSNDAVPLTALQRGMVYAALRPSGKGTNLLQAIVELDESVDPASLLRRLECLAGGTDLLRAVLDSSRESDPVWRTAERAVLEAKVVELEGPEALSAFLAEDRKKGFDLARDPLWRVTWLPAGATQFMVLTIHTALADRATAAWLIAGILSTAEGVQNSVRDTGLGPLVDKMREGARPGVADYWRSVLEEFDGPTPAPLAGERPEGGVVEEGHVVRECMFDTSDRAGSPPEGALFEAAAAILLSYYANTERVVFGSVKDLRVGWQEDRNGVSAFLAPGPAVAPLPVTGQVSPTTTFGELLEGHVAQAQQALTYSSVAPLDLMAASGFDSKEGLFPFVLLVESPSLLDQLHVHGVRSVREAWFDETPPYPMMLYVTPTTAGVSLQLRYDTHRLTDAAAELVLLRYERALLALQNSPGALVAELGLLQQHDSDWADSWMRGAAREAPSDGSVHAAVSKIACDTPDRVALVHGSLEVTYGELDRRSNQVANLLVERGVERGQLVALAVDRSIETVIGMLGVLKAGAGYVPMDPQYPADRLRFMLQDSEAPIALVTKGGLPDVDLTGVEVVELIQENLDRVSDQAPATPVDEAAVAYVIYTSGSTGHPKGVMVEHRNVLNFFQGMDERVPNPGARAVWLAVTSVSFDISVLELLWTLSRGFKVVLFDPTAPTGSVAPSVPRSGTIPMGLFYFAADEGRGEGNPYHLLLEGARFADENGFTAVWTPERHFHAFGGLYPNPSVTGAAVAAITKNVEIRAGSVVLPLHHPARVAEEWSVVDNLSGGRVGLAFASGWHPNDFVLRPEGYEERKAGLFAWADEVQRLWRGETIEYEGPTGEMVKVATLPRPIQAELPVWITAAGSPETVRRTGLAGHHLLTHLLGQTIQELADRIRIFREARREGGHVGPGQVAVMLHTFIGENDDEVREEVRAPMVEYLRSSMGLVRSHLTAWEAFSKKATGAAGPGGDEFDRLSDADVESLLNFSFERYYETSALLGSRERAANLMDQVLEAGATEIACLIDFGVSEGRALEALPLLRDVGQRLSGNSTVPPPDDGFPGFAQLIEDHGVTHLQCTPSLARLLMADAENTKAMSDLDVILIGGEAFSNALSTDLRAATSATILNMYGPTEATVWSSTREVSGDEKWGTIPLGKPLANLSYFVVDRLARPLPAGAAGELLISGESVTRGYWNRDALTKERFPMLPGHGQRAYRTGDLVRLSAEGELLFLGRMDEQVKIRGHRIELGEIESVLAAHPEVAEAAVTLSGEGRLTGHYVGLQKNEDAPDPMGLKDWMRDRLPEVMVPSHWVKLEALPKTPNLKVDRKSLGQNAETTSAVVDPTLAVVDPTLAPVPSVSGKRDTQKLVLAIWREELGIEEIGLDDNFFDLGGHSLLVVQVHLRLKSAMSRDFPITDLFQHPTVRSFAGALFPEEGTATDPGRKRAEMRKRMRRRTGSES